MPSDIPETYGSEDRSVPSPLPPGAASFFPSHLLAQCGRGRLVGSPGPGPISPIRQAASSVVFYAPIMCEILPIRERLSTRKNTDFKTHFLLWDYESPLRSLEVEHFLKIQFASHLETHLLCFPPSVLGRGEREAGAFQDLGFENLAAPERVQALHQKPGFSLELSAVISCSCAFLWKGASLPADRTGVRGGVAYGAGHVSKGR